MAAACPKCGHPIAPPQQFAPPQQWGPPQGQWPQQQQWPQQRPYLTPAQKELKSASTQLALWGLGIAGAFFVLAVLASAFRNC